MRSLTRITRWLAALPAALLLAALVLPGLALAHERRDIGGGKYTAVVGWEDEPTIQGQKNAAGFRITTKDGNQPVEGLEKTLKLTIAFGGGQPKEFPLRPVFKDPGHYVADIIPTKAGSYVWHLTGTIEGTAVDETFESGPGRFDDVQEATALEFPVPQGDPSAALAAAQAAQAEAASARTFGIAGVVLGALGLVAAAAAFVARRPTASTAGSSRLAGDTRS